MPERIAASITRAIKSASALPSIVRIALMFGFAAETLKVCLRASATFSAAVMMSNPDGCGSQRAVPGVVAVDAGIKRETDL